jgi:hypothetical protein
MAKPKRDPMLHRRRPTDEELDQEAIITEQDIEDAMSAFRRHAPPDARGLLDAEPVDEADA